MRAGGAAAAWASAALLAACGAEVVAPDPPKAFGARASAWFGCPAIEGAYAWPPVAGAWSEAASARGRRPWPDAVPLPVYGTRMEIRVRETPLGLVLQGRVVDLAPGVSDRLAREWSRAEYPVGSCMSGMREFAVRRADAGGPRAAGDPVAEGFRLARLADGALAVGVKTVERGRGGTVFSWGGQGHGAYELPDRVVWTWSKLARIEPAPGEAPPDAR